MSTISDALKKAQNQRQGGAPVAPPVVTPEPPRETGPRHSKPYPEPLRSSGQPSFILILVSVVIVLGIVLYFLRGTTVTVSMNPTSEIVGKTEVPVQVAIHSDIPPAPPRPEVADSSVPVAVEQFTDDKPVQVTPPVKEVAQPVRPKVIRMDVPVLGGTFYSEKNPVAIISGSAMKEGEMVGAYQVVRILPESVTLKCDGEEIVLRLK
ncbi:MAG: hypothetical protein WCI03_11425 [bacterium]|jgi:hypothetical protein